MIVLLALILSFPPAAPSPRAQEVITTISGGGPDGLPATLSSLGTPSTVLAGPGGEIFVAIWARVYRVDGQGMIHVVAGTGRGCQAAPYGDGLAARQACLSAAWGLALDGAGNLYISDAGHHVIRRVDALSGLVSKVAGGYVASYGGDGGPAASAFLSRPHGIAFDRSGNLFIADRDNHRIRRIAAATGVITTVAGTGAPTGSIDGAFAGDPRDNLGDGGPALSASLNSPYGLAVDQAGNIFVGDSKNNRVRRVDAATGVITSVAGDGSVGWVADGVEATTTGLAGPAHIALDSRGNLFIADSKEGSFAYPEIDAVNHRVRRVDAATGIIATVAGSDVRGYAGDGDSADGAALFGPKGVALDAQGNLFIADQWNGRIRRVDASTGIITTVAGTGPSGVTGDGFHASHASLDATALEPDAAGNLVVFDSGIGRIRRIDAATGIITTIAGNGSYGVGGDGGPALAAAFQYPFGSCRDAAGNIFVTDLDAGRVRRIDSATGIITRVAGQGYGYGGDGGSALNAFLGNPEDVAVSATGDLFISDTDNNRIRRVRNGIITTVAGTGLRTGIIDGPGGNPADDLGDGGPAIQASLSSPAALLFEPSGDLLIVDHGNHRIRRLGVAGGTITTIVGDGIGRYAGDGGPAAGASLKFPTDIAYDSTGDLFITDTSNHRVRRVDALTGIITTAAGDGTDLHGADGTPATSAGIPSPGHVAIDPSGRLYVTTERFVRALVPGPLPSGSVPDTDAATVRPLDVTRLPGGDLILSWSPSCVMSDGDFIVYEGALGDWASHAPRLCSTGGATAATLTPSSGNSYYLVVPRNPLAEGSLGRRSDGAPRPEGTSTCLLRLAGGTCP